MSGEFKPRRLRLMDPGFVNYTGPMGQVDFTDGVSDEKVAWREAQMLASLTYIEDADKPGYQLGPHVEEQRQKDRDTSDPIVALVDSGEHVNPEGAPVMERFTRADLEKIADEKGLEGVRSIARAWNRTGRSIAETISAIMDAQGGHTEVAKREAAEASAAGVK
jgi:hypothetical protein